MMAGGNQALSHRRTFSAISITSPHPCSCSSRLAVSAPSRLVLRLSPSAIVPEVPPQRAQDAPKTQPSSEALTTTLAYTVEYYSALKRKKILTHATTGMKLENIMLSEISQTQKDKYCTIPLTGNIQDRQIHRDRNRIVVPRG